MAVSLWGQFQINKYMDSCSHITARMRSVMRLVGPDLIQNRTNYTYSGGSRGGGGVPPPFGPRCRLFNIGPKVGPPLGPPPLFACLRWTPVADPGCVWQGWSPPPPWNVDDVTRAMPKGGCLWMSKSGGVFQFFWGRMTSRGQCPRGGGACEKSCICAWTPPPLKKSWIRPWFIW